MRRVAAVVVAVAGVLVVAGPGAIAAGGAGADGPTLYAPASAAPGGEITVRGDGWPESRLVSVEICGNGGLGGSAHCDPLTATSLATHRDGGLVGPLTVGAPPSPCPCVVHAFVPGMAAAATAELTIAGLPTVPPVEPEAEPGPHLDVDASLRDASPRTAWFGAAPRHELVLVVENVGEIESAPAPLEVAWGRGRAEPTRLVDAPGVPALAPGDSQRLVVPVELDPLAFGDYVVRGEVTGVPASAFRLETTTYPWGLGAIPGLVLLLVVVNGGRAVLARRGARRAGLVGLLLSLLVPAVAAATASADVVQPVGEPERPVLLIGGTFAKNSYFEGPYNNGDTVPSWLENLGYDVYTMELATDPQWTPDLDAFFASIAESVGYRPGDIGGAGTASILPTDDGTPSSGLAVADKVDAILAETGADRVDIIGHSQGATVARWYAKNLGVGKVGTMVSLGGGEWGLSHATIGCAPPLRFGVCDDMVMTDGVETPFLMGLNDENPLPEDIVGYYHFWGSDDRPGIFALGVAEPINTVDSGMRLPGAISRGADDVCPEYEVLHIDEWADAVMQDMMVAALQGDDFADFQSPNCPPPEEPFERCEAPCDLSQIVELDVAGGLLTMQQPGSTVALEAVTLDGTAQATGGALSGVTVTDRRGDGAGWSVTGQVTDFTVGAEPGECPAGDGGTWRLDCVPGDNLGWAPGAAVAHGAVPGDVAVAAPGSSLDAGLGSAARSLCTSPATRSGGTFGCGATLELAVPASAAAGSYTATLTVTLA